MTQNPERRNTALVVVVVVVIERSHAATEGAMTATSARLPRPRSPSMTLAPDELLLRMTPRANLPQIIHHAQKYAFGVPVQMLVCRGKVDPQSVRGTLDTSIGEREPAERTSVVAVLALLEPRPQARQVKDVTTRQNLGTLCHGLLLRTDTKRRQWTREA